MAAKVCAVIGVGPGIGSAVSKKFAKEGYSVAMLARKMESLEPVETEIKQLFPQSKILSVTADATNENEMKQAFTMIKNTLGSVNVLVFNAGAFKM